MREAKLLSGCDANLFAHQINAGDLFGYRVLNLQTGVHLHEEELAVLVQELHRSGAAIARALGRVSAANLPIAARWSWVQDGGGAFLEQFLVAALDRAITFAQMDGIAEVVAE